MNGRMTITEVAERVRVCTKTIMRWECSGKIQKAKRDRRGWRTYDHDDIEKLIEFHDSLVSVDVI